MATELNGGARAPDVLIVNSIGEPFTGADAATRALGGSEWEISQVAEALVRRGHSVVVAGTGSAISEHAGVRYVPLGRASECWPSKALYIQRISPRPVWCPDLPPAVIVRANDIYVPGYDVHKSMLESGRATLVCNSIWQSKGFWFAAKKRVINPLLGPTPPTDKVPGRFVFAAGVMKGWGATALEWHRLKAKYPEPMAQARMLVVNPGWGERVQVSAEDAAAGIEFAGAPTAEEYRSLVASAEGLFYVATMAEVWCNLAAIAERAGTRTHILCKAGLGGIPEALVDASLVTTNDSDFEREFIARIGQPPVMRDVPDRSADAMVTQWEDVLGLPRDGLPPRVLPDIATEPRLDEATLGNAEVSGEALLASGAARDLREKLCAIASDALNDVTASDYWRGRSLALADMAKAHEKDAPEAWLSWSNDVDHEEMPCFGPWYDALRSAPDWETRWKPLSRRPLHGKPHPFARDAGTSPVPLQHAYHLRAYETADGGRRFLDDIDVVVEVGGGYGNFARMLREDGFRGTHYIIDLPHTREFQRAYLRLCGVPLLDTAGDASVDGVDLVGEADIDEVVSATAGKRIAFVATWSLSETPPAFRAKLFPALHAACRKYLMATQWPTHFVEPWVSNESYFTAFAVEASKSDPSKHFAVAAVPEFTGSRYVFGFDRAPTGPMPDATARPPVLPPPAAATGSIESRIPPERIAANEAPLSPYFGEFLSLLRKSLAPGGSEFGLGLSLFSLVVSTRARIVVEIGRFKGFSTLALASGLKLLDEGWTEPGIAHQRPDVDYARLEEKAKRVVLSIDPHPTQEAADLLRGAGLLGYVHPIDQKSDEVTLKGDAPDLVFIDGDHSEAAVRRDVQRFLPLLRAGGYLVMHDYFGWYQGNANGSAVKKLAEELAAGGMERVVVDTGYASLVVLRKPTAFDRVPTKVPARADGKPTIGLVLLAKNESPIVARAARSCAAWIDCVTVLVDSETTDDTADLARALGAEVHIRPYAGSLAETRNEALAIAEQRTDYMIVVDADDMVEGPRPDLSDGLDCYELMIRDGTASYPRVQLLKSKTGFRYDGCDRGCKMNIPHEFLNRPGATCRPMPELIYRRLGGVKGVSGWQDQAGARDKYLRHARDLMKHHLVHPEDTRTVFYLGQSYRDAGEPAESRVWYRKRAGMGGWDEEAWYSSYQVALLTELLGEDPVAAYLVSHEQRPSRAEPLMSLARWYRDDKRKQFNSAYAFARRAAELPLPPTERLFVAPSIYAWEAKVECALAAHYTGRQDEAIGLLEGLRGVVPDSGWLERTIGLCVAKRAA